MLGFNDKNPDEPFSSVKTGVHQENTTKKRLRFTFTRLTNFYIGMSDEYLGR